MGLYLIESSSLKEIVHTEEALHKKVELLQNHLEQNDATLLEIQISTDYARAFIIVEANSEEKAAALLEEKSINVDLIKSVRLVGDDLDRIKGNKDVLNYLVEWNLPENLTMEQYLERKRTNSVHYEEVPEVEFARTYVCEDMTKCLCFYDAPDQAAVERAREAVKAPIDTITEILPPKK